MQKPRIVLTNDDGIHGPGLAVLRRALEPLGELTVIAPDRECSAVSHSFSLHRPLRATTLSPREIVLDGTPVDCVIFLRTLFRDDRPALLVSGINNGPNLGADIYYSGTVAAAHEGQINGIPSIAVSVDCSYARGHNYERNTHFAAAASHAARIAGQVLERGLPPETFLNVNVPNRSEGEIRGVRVTRLGKRVYRDVMEQRTDPRGWDYYWVGGEEPSFIDEPDTDFAALRDGFVSVTPIRFNVNDDEILAALRAWPL